MKMCVRMKQAVAHPGLDRIGAKLGLGQSLQRGAGDEARPCWGLGRSLKVYCRWSTDRFDATKSYATFMTLIVNHFLNAHKIFLRFLYFMD